jgi:hypothetical protein
LTGFPFEWTKERGAPHDLANALDYPENLWCEISSSTHHGINDKVPEENAKALTNSLLLIQPEELKIRVGAESQFAGPVLVQRELEELGSGDNDLLNGCL